MHYVDQPPWVYAGMVFILTLAVLNLHFLLYLHTVMTQVVGILSQERYGPVSFIESLPLLLMIWWGKEPGHQNPDSKVHGDNMGPIWGRQDQGGPHVGPVNFAIWETRVFTWFSQNVPVSIMKELKLHTKPLTMKYISVQQQIIS